MSTTKQSVILIALISSISCASSSPKCRGLALEGGGDRGAYQAGIFNGLVEALPPEEIAYDVISGISAGSVNGAVFGLFPKGEERQVADLITTVWDTLDASAIYKNWPLGPLEGLIHEPGLFTTEPLRELLESVIGDRPYQERDVFMGTNDINKGIFHEFHNMKLTREEYIDAILSSSAVPFVFPDIQWDDIVAVDGGTKINLSADPIITECRSKGFADEDIIVDAAYCVGYDLPPIEGVDLKTWSMPIRILEMFIQDVTSNFLVNLKRAYPKVNFRYFVMPSKDKPVPDFPIPLVFIHKDIENMLKAGYSQALETISEGPGSALKRIIEEIESLNEGNDLNSKQNFIF